MLMNEAYPSKYLKADDLQGRTVQVKISKVLYEEIGHDRKVAMYFQGKERGIILNKTNANTIAAIYGPDTDNWVGGELELFPTMTDFQGKSVPAIRVRVPPRRPQNGNAPNTGPVNVAPNARAAQPAKPAFDDDFEPDSDIPF